MAAGVTMTPMQQICRAARLNREQIEDVLEAQQYKPPSGPFLDEWSVEFHTAVTSIHLETMPTEVVARYFAAAGKLAELMRQQIVADYIRADWDLLARWWELSSKTAAAILPGLEPPEVTEPARADHPMFGRRDKLPAVRRVDHLAEIIDPASARERLDVLGRVADYCDSHCYGDVTAQEIHWLNELARGTRIVDLATDSGISERHFFRALRALWKKLGVDGRVEAIAHAAEAGWLSEDLPDPAPPTDDTGQERPPS